MAVNWSCQKFVRISYLAQEDIFEEEKSIRDNLMSALDEEDIEDTEKYYRVDTLVSRAEFPDVDVAVDSLSGGWRKRLSICRAMLVDSRCAGNG